MSVLDGAIVNIALPSIARNLGAAPAEAVWIVNAYQVAIVVALLPLSFLGQTATFRRVFLCGLALFVLASAGCCAARSLPELAAARVIQGLGAAGIMSNNGALLRFIFPASRLGRGLGLNAMVIAISAAIGPSVASAVLTIGPWPLLFAINVPIGLAAWALGWFALPVTPCADHKLDRMAVALNVIAFGTLIVGIDLLTRGGPFIVGALVAGLGIVAGWLLVRRSRHQRWPLVPVDLFRIRPFALAVVTSVASFTAQMLAFISLPFLFQNTLHLSQTQTGLFLSAWPIAVAVSAPIAGRLSDQMPSGLLGAIGMAVLALGLFFLTMLSRDSSIMAIIWPLAICGFGFGFFQSPNNRDLLGSAPQNRAGAAGGMLSVARLTGQTAGASLAAAVFATTSYGGIGCLRIAILAALAAAAASMTKRAGP